jgi:Sec-independent protein translocase protein TatA
LNPQFELSRSVLLLSPEKVLVVLVVAVIVLGPERLPKVARQIGSLWRDLRAFHQRLESEARTTFPDLPSTESVVNAVRRPLSLLEDLSDPLPRRDESDNEAVTVVEHSGGSYEPVNGDRVATDINRNLSEQESPMSMPRQQPSRTNDVPLGDLRMN